MSGCGIGGKIDGADTGGPTKVVAAMDLTASKLTLLTNGTDSITFTVFAKDAKNAAATAADISVESTGASLSASTLTTGTDGKATFTLSVANEKSNRQISVTLTAGSVVKTQEITISGTTLTLLASKSVTTPTDASPIELTAKLRDAADQPISATAISFSSSLANTFTPSSGYAFTTGSTGVTDSAGLFKVKYIGTHTGSDTVTASSSGATKDVSLTSNAVSLAFFGFTDPDTPTTPVYITGPLTVNVSETQDLTVLWLDSLGNPKNGQTLTFYTTKGYFGGVDTTWTTAVTDDNGVATLAGSYNTGATAGPAAITVYDESTVLTAELKYDVRATIPKSINLQVTPGVIPTSTVTKTSTATLKATVRDANAQAVAGKVVGFSIFKGPGSGEFVSPVTAITDSGGVATSTFTSGSGTSAQDGVVLRATVAGVATPAESTLTIARTAAVINIGTTNKLAKDGDSKYVQEFTVLVTDSSGGAVEGALVSLRMVPIRFYTGPYTDPDPLGTGSLWHTAVFQTEDLNKNYILDAGEDCALQLNPAALDTPMLFGPSNEKKYWQNGSTDNFSTIIQLADVGGVKPSCTGNGRLDPGAVASIEPTVTTGADGMGLFHVSYPKSFGSWVDVEITATTDVTGTNASATIEYYLNVIEGDKPYLSSPFGLGEAP